MGDEVTALRQCPRAQLLSTATTLWWTGRTARKRKRLAGLTLHADACDRDATRSGARQSIVVRVCATTQTCHSSIRAARSFSRLSALLSALYYSTSMPKATSTHSGPHNPSARYPFRGRYSLSWAYDELVKLKRASTSPQSASLSPLREDRRIVLVDYCHLVRLRALTASNLKNLDDDIALCEAVLELVDAREKRHAELVALEAQLAIPETVREEIFRATGYRMPPSAMATPQEPKERQV